MTTIQLSKGQSAALDWLRGMAAQLVVVGHLISAAGYDQRIVIQDTGVVVFFLLSGFLIARSALGKSEYSFRAARVR